MTHHDDTHHDDIHDDDTRNGDDTGLATTGPTDPEAGLATAEYAIATVAAVGFAGLLIAVLKSDTVRGLLEGIISSALSV